ncbi:MAG TPA: hypothetical protein VFD58_29965 [Blastocatellia bacterium]|nr:hypothetical protein [Blastocatellia bacterium]
MKVSAHRRRRVLLYLAVMICALAAPAIPSQAQSRRYEQARDLVSRVQQDLRHAADFIQRSKDKDGRERFENAQKHLSEFDRALSKGKFDKDKLDEAIDDLKNVVEHNTLAGEDRDALTQDVRDLRQLRSDRGR